jgi:hypothetical protein
MHHLIWDMAPVSNEVEVFFKVRYTLLSKFLLQFRPILLFCMDFCSPVSSGYRDVQQNRIFRIYILFNCYSFDLMKPFGSILKILIACE